MQIEKVSQAATLHLMMDVHSFKVRIRTARLQRVEENHRPHHSLKT